MATYYEIEGKDNVLCQSLTFGYLYDVEQGLIPDNDMLGAVVDGTNLDKEGVRALSRVQVNEIWELVKRETYPELYEEDGSEKDLSNISESNDKKKA